MLSSVFVFGQGYVYKNDFSDPLINEKSSNADGNRIELKDGYLYCEQLKSNFYWCIAERIFIDTERDYEIEMKLKPYETDPYLSEFGLVFGLKNVSMFNSFIMTATGDVAVNSKVYDTEIPYLNPVPVNGYRMGDWCVFKIVSKSGRMNFYFNNQLVFERKKIDMLGRWFGWYTNGKTGIQLDYFYIKQDRGQVNLLPEANEFKKERLKGVNSDKDEVSPQISDDGKRLHFAKFINPGTSFYTICKEGNLGFYSADADTAGNVSSLARVQIPVPNPWYIASVPHYQSFLVGEKDNLFSSTGYQLTMCNLKTGTTDPARSIRFNGASNVAIRHANVSKDGSVMVISGYENYEPTGLDLYVSFKNGVSWSVPKKIAALNTKGDEITPFISPDMKKIYFSSDGHPGYGFTDIFVVNRQDDSWLNWSKPLNMGKGVNDAAFNEFFVMPDTTAGNFAYMSSSYGNINNLDIFKVRIKKSIRSETQLPVTLKGKVIYAEDTKDRLSTLSIEIAGKKKTNLKLNLTDDEFTTLIKNDETFTFQLNDTNFVILEKTISDKHDSPPQIEVKLKVAKIKRGESFVLENIYFTPNKYDLLPTSFPALDALTLAMVNNPRLRIEVQGHTSRTNESAKFNLELSTQRANAVKQYLILKGVSESRIIAKGYGYTQPRYSDDVPDHQAANRRVEIKILEK